MDTGMNRRDFLKYSVATGVLIAAGESMIDRVMADEMFKVSEIDKLTIWVLTDNFYDTNRADKVRWGRTKSTLH